MCSCKRSFPSGFIATKSGSTSFLASSIYVSAFLHLAVVVVYLRSLRSGSINDRRRSMVEAAASGGTISLEVKGEIKSRRMEYEIHMSVYNRIHRLGNKH